MARIAMVLARSPGAPMTGRKAVLHSALAALTSLGHEVDLIVLARPDPVFRHAGKVIWLGSPGKPRVLFNVARAVLGGEDSLNEALFRSGRLLASLRPLRGEYDVAIADTIRVARYAAELGVPWHLDMDDLFSARYEKFAQAGEMSAELVLGYYRDSAPRLASVLPGAVMKQLLRQEAARIRKRELHWAREATTVSLVSADEAERFARAAGRPVHSLPMSVGTPGARWAPEAAGAQPVFVGPLEYKPNLDSLLYYQREIYPALQAGRAVPLLHHIGAAPERLRRLFSEQVVRFEGYVADLAARLREAAFFMAPITTGTGIKTKVLEAMAAGVPVVTTSEGVSGLRVQHRRHCFVCERTSDFPLAIGALADRALAAEVSTNGASYVAQNFSAEALRRKWAAVLQELRR